MSWGPTRVKVCCIQNLAEAQLAARCGASALGLVSAMPSGPGPIPEDEIAAIAAHTPPGIATFLLTCRQDAAGIVEQQRRTGVGVVQLCDRLAPAEHRLLRAALPGVKLVQVVHVADESALEEAQACAPEVDAILLDSGRPDAATKELGGTGRAHDWSLSRRIVEAVAYPVFLAGGLHPGNVAAAIREVRPFGVDVCSRLRVGGRLDEALLQAFVAAVRSV